MIGVTLLNFQPSNPVAVIPDSFHIRVVELLFLELDQGVH